MLQEMAAAHSLQRNPKSRSGSRRTGASLFLLYGSCQSSDWWFSGNSSQRCVPHTEHHTGVPAAGQGGSRPSDTPACLIGVSQIKSQEEYERIWSTKLRLVRGVLNPSAVGLCVCRDDLPRVLTSSLCFWGPINVINFRFAPPDVRVVFTSVASVMWNTYLSIVQHEYEPQSVKVLNKMASKIAASETRERGL